MAWTQITDFNLSSFQGVTDFVVESSLGLFGTLLCIAVFILFTFFYWLSSKDLIGAFAVGGLAVFTTGLLLFIASMISTGTFIIILGVAILSWAGLFIPRN